MRHRLPLLVLALAVLCVFTPPAALADTLRGTDALNNATDGRPQPVAFADDDTRGLEAVLGLMDAAPAGPPLPADAEWALLLAGGGRSPDAACHGWVTCPSPQSCGSWSSWYNCDSPCCGYDSLCEAKGTDATLQPKERFRFCVLQDGSDCFEYQTATFRAHCGCLGVPEC